MKKIYKSKLNPYNGETSVWMAKGAKILRIASQGGTTCKEEPCVWFEFDTSVFENEQRILTTYGTGEQIPDDMVYLGTYSLQDGRFMGHVYEKAK